MKRDRMGLEELLNDVFLDEPITIVLRNGVVVKGHVYNRHRRLRDSEMPTVTIVEDHNMSTVPDNDIESVVLEDVEWRRRGT